MRLILLGLALPLLLAIAEKPQPAASSGPLVHLTSGTLMGKLEGTIAVFEAIPFAQPPVGPLRWREPQPVAAWSGVRDATTPAHPCMQRVEGTDSFLEPLAAAYGVAFTRQPVDPSEDCLYLNVWTPQLQAAANLPVMVWLHGGSNRVGSGTEAGYDGAVLASHGVVVVTINYRLGAMGFLSHPELTAESPHHSSGNYGLLDQIAALQWVQQNIAQFGGAPGNVTLFGESAGSVDATTLWVLPQSPASAFASGKIQPVDLLAGLNAREFSAFRVVAAAAAKKSPQPAPKPALGDELKQFADLARPLYGNWTDLAVATYAVRILMHGAPAVDQASNDVVAACPIGAEAALTTSAGRRAFVYRFDRSVPGKGESDLGAFHSLEIPYVFGTFQTRGFRWLPFTSTDFKLSQIVLAYWINFARSGDPNGPGLPHWVAWSTDQESYVSFNQNGEADPQQHFSPMYCHLSPERLQEQLANY